MRAQDGFGAEDRVLSVIPATSEVLLSGNLFPMVVGATVPPPAEPGIHPIGCGGRGMACCAIDPACTPDSTCVDGSCQACGHADEPCCSAGTACQSGSVCWEGSCLACGSLWEICRPIGPQCNNAAYHCDSRPEEGNCQY